MLKNVITLLIALCFLSLTSCKPQKHTVGTPIQTIDRIVERLVPYTVPADSAAIIARLACDSLNNVYVREINELKSKGIETDLKLNDNTLIYVVKKPPDTVYVKVTDTTRYREIPIYIDVPVEVNKLTWFQKTMMWIGSAVVILITGFGIQKIYRFIKQFKK